MKQSEKYELGPGYTFETFRVYDKCHMHEGKNYRSCVVTIVIDNLININGVEYMEIQVEAEAGDPSKVICTIHIPMEYFNLESTHFENNIVVEKLYGSGITIDGHPADFK